MELKTENTRLRRAVSDLTLDKMILAEAAMGNISAARRRACVEHVVAELGVPERRACRVLGPWKQGFQAFHAAQVTEHTLACPHGVVRVECWCMIGFGAKAGLAGQSTTSGAGGW
jgi:hypothetical protein